MNDGGPAFPFNNELGDGSYETYSGMSLRDWFAGMALSRVAGGHTQEGKAPTMGMVADECYAYADAMLKERDK